MNSSIFWYFYNFILCNQLGLSCNYIYKIDITKILAKIWSTCFINLTCKCYSNFWFKIFGKQGLVYISILIKFIYKSSSMILSKKIQKNDW